MKTINHWNTLDDLHAPSAWKTDMRYGRTEIHPFKFAINHNPLVLYPRTSMVVFLIIAITAASRLSAQEAPDGMMNPWQTNHLIS